MGIDVINYQEIPIYRAVSLLIGVLIIEVSITNNWDFNN